MHTISSMLHAIVADQKKHARFLNTLSLMELCGAQKISRIIKHDDCSSFLLEHVAEEYRHAFFLRKLAHKIYKNKLGNFSKENVFCFSTSKKYITNLDRHICVLLKKYNARTTKHSAYLLTTFAIEQRALPFYNHYQSILDEHGIFINIKSLISEEKKHLQEIKAQLAHEHVPTALIDACVAQEKILFSQWIMHVNREITAQLCVP